jgi:hypothetical protein
MLYLVLDREGIFKKWCGDLDSRGNDLHIVVVIVMA